MKKSNTLKKEALWAKEQADLAIKKQQEIQSFLEKAEKEELEQLTEIEAEIQAIADKNGMFCGIILDHQNLLSVIDIALKTKESIQIPFKLYFKQNE